MVDGRGRGGARGAMGDQGGDGGGGAAAAAAPPTAPPRGANRAALLGQREKEAQGALVVGPLV